MNQWSTLVRSRLNLTVVEGFDGTVTECPDCCDSLTARSEPSRRLQRNGTHALTCMQNGEGGSRGQRAHRATAMKFTLIRALRAVARPEDLGADYLSKVDPTVTRFYPAKPTTAVTADNNRADFALYMNASFLADAVLTTRTPPRTRRP